MILAAFIIAALCGMGVGSGGLFIVYLTAIAGIEQLAAQGLNLYFFIFATAGAAIIHLKSGKLQLGRLALICIIGGIGCFFGASLAQIISATLLKKVFAAFLIISGVISFFNAKNASAK